MTTTLTLKTPRLTAFEQAIEQIHAKPERLLEFNAPVAHLLQQLCDQWPALELILSDSPRWSLYAGVHDDHELWRLGACEGLDQAPVGYLAPAYLNGYRWGRNSALNHDTLRQEAFKPYVRGWTERDSSALEF